MITIPDAIAKLRMILKRTIDIPLSWIEHIGSKMNVYAWQKRWGNRKQGTGYRQPDDDCQ